MPAPRTWMSLLAVPLLAGCTATRPLERLESQLRRREDEIAALHDELATLRSDLHVARREALHLREQLSAETPALLPEQSALLAQAAGIRFNGLLTTGVDHNDQPGDEYVSAMIAPYDTHGSLIRLPGTLDVQLLDLAAPDGAQKLGHWTFSPEQAHTLWHSGFFASGYLLKLVWDQPPQHAELTLHARLVSPDGRAFTCTQQVRVSPEGSPLQTAGGTKERTAHRPVGPAAVRAGTGSPVESPAVKAPAAAPEVSSAGPSQVSGDAPPRNLPAAPQSGPVPLPAPAAEGAIDTSDRFPAHELPTRR